MGSDSDLPASHKQPGIGTRWVLEVDDVGKTFAEMKTRGVKFLDAQPREEGWGFSADLVDPDGDHFTIHETRKPSATADWAKRARRHTEPTIKRVGLKWLGRVVVNLSA